MKFHTIIWDMDGVLVDSERHWDQLDSFFLEDIVPQWDQFDEDLLTGRSIKDIHDMLSADYGLEMDFESYVDHYNKVARKIYGEKADLMPYARETLSAIAELGARQALASSSYHTWIGYAMQQFEIRDYFDKIISAEDVDGRGKPAPDIYLEALRQLNIEPDDALVVEDSAVGVQAAKAAGLTVVGYQSAINDQNLDSAHTTVSDLRQVSALLESGVPVE
ncbi:MAG: HAD-IA family hydrolase [Candidatus Marinimicrobia bacterium]|nr:HAD-IA family hydrolase [Candidatus Neomarinimicrobiota bacterium]